MSVEHLAHIDPTRKKNRILTVTGVSGCGKDFLTEEAIRAEQALIGNRINVFNFGTQLLRTSQEMIPDTMRYGRDDLKTLPLHILQQCIDATIRQLVHSQPALELIHVVFRQQGSLVVGLQNEVQTNALQYIYVEADPLQIRAWRNADNSGRKRMDETPEEIRLHQDIARETVLAIARYLGAGMLLIRNDAANTQHNVAVLNEEAHSLL